MSMLVREFVCDLSGDKVGIVMVGNTEIAVDPAFKTMVTIKGTNQFTNETIDKTIEMFRDEVNAQYDFMSKQNPDFAFYFQYDDTNSFIAGPAYNQYGDEQKVRNGEMTWDEFDTKWYPQIN